MFNLSRTSYGCAGGRQAGRQRSNTRNDANALTSCPRVFPVARASVGTPPAYNIMCGSLFLTTSSCVIDRYSPHIVRYQETVTISDMFTYIFME